jgi:hypothetical protein
MDEMTIKAGAQVLMAGCGAKAQTGNFTSVGPLSKMEKQWAYRDLFARIIFSIGPESELVTSGIISNAAHCPGSIVKSDNFTYGEYYLILPRLNTTIKRFEDGASLTGASGAISLAYTDLQSITGISCDRTVTPAHNYDVSASGNLSNYRMEAVNMLEEQEPWQFETSRLRDDPVWHFDFSKSGTLQMKED